MRANYNFVKIYTFVYILCNLIELKWIYWLFLDVSGPSFLWNLATYHVECPTVRLHFILSPRRRLVGPLCLFPYLCIFPRDICPSTFTWTMIFIYVACWWRNVWVRIAQVADSKCRTALHERQVHWGLTH